MNLIVPSFVKVNISTLEGCGTTKANNARTASPFSLVIMPQRRDHAPLSDDLQGGDRNFAQYWSNLHNSIRGSHNRHNAFTTPSFRADFFRLGFQQPKSKNFINGMGGIIKSLLWTCECPTLIP
jgi:hypothetical protein